MNDAHRLKRYLAEEMVEEYEDGRMSRRQMIETVGRIFGVAIVSPTLLASLGCSNPEANVEEPEAAPVPQSNTNGITVEPDDPDIEVSEVEVPGEAGTIEAYQARPSSEGPFAAILLIHENRGLTDHIRDVTRRFAKVGYTGLAVDLLSRVGGTSQFADEAEVTTAISALDPEGVISDLKSSVTWLEKQPYVQEGKIGGIGWCWGGGQAWRLATKEPRMSAVVAFYGPNPPLEDVPDIQAAVLGIYGAEDQRIMDQEPELEEALAAAGKTYKMQVFEGANHAFFNDTGERFNPEAAREAWSYTMDWFGKYL
ncbi:MAG: carboxymethylenebutenolidase [Rubrobacteraceae bacterium]|nr:carboxymethylenebutenolidase [Rubrobacteraceae bacterium]